METRSDIQDLRRREASGSVFDSIKGIDWEDVSGSLETHSHGAPTKRATLEGTTHDPCFKMERKRTGSRPCTALPHSVG